MVQAWPPHGKRRCPVRGQLGKRMCRPVGVCFTRLNRFGNVPIKLRFALRRSERMSLTKVNRKMVSAQRRPLRANALCAKVCAFALVSAAFALAFACAGRPVAGRTAPEVVPDAAVVSPPDAGEAAPRPEPEPPPVPPQPTLGLTRPFSELPLPKKLRIDDFAGFDNRAWLLTDDQVLEHDGSKIVRKMKLCGAKRLRWDHPPTLRTVDDSVRSLRARKPRERRARHRAATVEQRRHLSRLPSEHRDALHQPHPAPSAF